MEGRGTLQSSCWLYLQLVKIRESQMVSHQLFCSWPQRRQLGETNTPTTLSAENSTKKEKHLLLAKLQFIIQKKERVKENCFTQLPGERDGKWGGGHTYPQPRSSLSNQCSKTWTNVVDSQDKGAEKSFGCSRGSHVCSLWCFTFTPASLISYHPLKW